MRVLVVDTYYDAFLRAHYAERPELAAASYEEQLRALLRRHFGTGDAYARHLRGLGHEARDVVVNCAPLQAAWARERLPGAALHDLTGRVPGRPGALLGQAALRRIALAQVRAFRPDVVYLQDLWFFSRPELELLGRMVPLVAGQIASHPPASGRLRGLDLILTSFPHYVERFRALGVASEYLAIAFDEQVHDVLRAEGVDPSAEADRDLGAVFVGGVDPDVHPAGTALIARLCERVGLDVWGYGAERLAPGSPIAARHHGEAWGLDMNRVLARARIVVNRHIEAAEGHANNMRLFEATGMGAVLVTEEAPNLGTLFAPGAEVVTYRDETQLVERVEGLLADDHDRTTIAAAGQRRTLRDHTYAVRIAELAAILERHLP